MVVLCPIENPGKAGSVAPILKDFIWKMNRWEFKWRKYLNGFKENVILLHITVTSVQFISVAQLCPIHGEPMDYSTPGFPVHHQSPELTQTHVHQAGDAIQPSHPLSYLSPPTFNLSKHQGLFKWVSSSYQVAIVLEFQLQHQSFKWLFRTDFL